MRTTLALLAILFTMALAGCGGGGGGAPACKPGVSTMLFPQGCEGDALGGGATAQPGPPWQIVFVSALPQNIALKGTGGPGRQETSTVTFRVLDRDGNAVPGVAIDFTAFSNTTSPDGTGGLTLAPIQGVSDTGGAVSTVVAAGIVNTPVRVSATVRDSAPAITGISDQLVVSTGIPDQNSFTLVAPILNLEGMNHTGRSEPVAMPVTVHLADHFNNPVPDGTAVSFTAEGGSIGASCLTGLANTQLTDGAPITQSGLPGSCTVRFLPANPRPVDGRVTVLAYALGEESFVDDPAIAGSINRYDPGEPFEDLCEPFRDDRAITDRQANSTLLDSAVQACPSPVLGEPYIDTNANGVHDTRGDGRYNGVLNIDPTTGRTVASARTPAVHVRGSTVLVMSTSQAAIDPLGPATLALDSCVDGTPFDNAPRSFAIAVRDVNPTIFPGNTLSGNILPAGTNIAFEASNGKLLGDSSVIVPNTNNPSAAVWTYLLTLQSDATQSGPGTVSDGVTNPGYVCTNPIRGGPLTVRVTTPLGVVTTRSFTVTD